MTLDDQVGLDQRCQQWCPSFSRPVLPRTSPYHDAHLDDQSQRKSPPRENSKTDVDCCHLKNSFLPQTRNQIHPRRTIRLRPDETMPQCDFFLRPRHLHLPCRPVMPPLRLGTDQRESVHWNFAVNRLRWHW